MSNESEKQQLKSPAKSIAGETSESRLAGSDMMNEQQSTSARSATTDQPHAGEDVYLPLELQGHLGRHLRSVYRELTDQPVPDKFLKLLEQLKETESPPEGSK